MQWKERQRTQYCKRLLFRLAKSSKTLTETNTHPITSRLSINSLYGVMKHSLVRVLRGGKGTTHRLSATVAKLTFGLAYFLSFRESGNGYISAVTGGDCAVCQEDTRETYADQRANTSSVWQPCYMVDIFPMWLETAIYAGYISSFSFDQHITSI